ncbi:MAG: glycosyl hydrolase [Herpetosiphonaceae bacterium]|nr:glycosyl hydrolase [Herpetosiphonaceae bacterium]
MAEANQFDELREWRCIGPFRGGRVVAVAGDYQHANVFYFGGCAGGVWKTTDTGTYWQNVSDGFFNTAAVGALAVAPSDSNVIYAGTGETTIRLDVSHGDGVYKSTDAGTTWQHMGLADTRFIGKIRVHPHSPDIVYVAALGHAFGPNEERGVFKSEDGGTTWRQVFSKSSRAGAVDLSLDATNPRRLYAAIWQAHRNFWDISSGGADSGLWRSTDAGETWGDLSNKSGMPEGIKGKIGVATSPAQAGRVWALIEHATAGGLYRSDDGGESWERVCADQNLISRAWYYMHLTADPQDPETVYVNNLSLWKSTDGGKTFTEMATPHGDNHDLWIDPRNPQRMIQGNDGGACVSLTGGATWSSIYNQPTAQFYHIATDTRSPYTVYGTQQDNSSIAVPSRTAHPGITWGDCFIPGTGESGYIAVRPDDPDIVYVGAIGSSPGGGNALQRYDHRTKQVRLITTWPESMSGHGAIEHKYRFAWTYPIVISPHDPHVLYIGGNMVFRTTNEGQSWEPISPDLTRAEPEKLQPTGGPINRDAVGAEVYATVFAFAESPHTAGVLWAGSDDGLVHLSRNGGADWSNITPSDLPIDSLISCIELSPHDPSTAYLAATRYKLDDYRPYLYKTTDDGQHWQRIDNGIAAYDFTRVIRADPQRRGLLYAGTETGLYISFDDGEAWQRFQLNLPVAPLYDLLVKDRDLIAATHGRSIWVLDDITPLRQQVETVTAHDVHLLKPASTIHVAPRLDSVSSLPGKNYVGSMGGAFITHKTAENAIEYTFLDAGENPPRGAVISYYLKQPPAAVISLRFADATGHEIRTFTSTGPSQSAEQQEKGKAEDKELKIPAQVGWNRFLWDLHYPPAVKVEGTDPPAELTLEGPLAVPGNYQVTLTVGEQQITESFEIVGDPAAPASQVDLQAQFDLLLQIHTKTNDLTAGLNCMRDLRAQLDGWRKRMAGQANGAGIAETATKLYDQVLEIEKTFQVPDLRPGWADNLNAGARLLEQIAALPPVVALGNYRPTDASYAVFNHLSAKIDTQLDRFNQLIATELPALNRQIAAAQFGAVIPLTHWQSAVPAEATPATTNPPSGVGGMEGGEGGPTASGPSGGSA